MWKFLQCGVIFVFPIVSLQVHAQSIADFWENEHPSVGYFNCAYKQKIASKKCKVTWTLEKGTDANIKPWTTDGQSTLSIYWPDNDISRYAEIDSYELYNLGNKKFGYKFRTTQRDFTIDYSKGLIIEYQNKEHIRLW